MLPSTPDVSFEQPFSKYKLQADINVVPYIDVMLVLLVVFMITAPLMTQGIKVDLPQAVSQPMQANEETVVISVSADNKYFVNLGDVYDKARSRQELTALLLKANALKDSKLQVFIEGDKSLEYGKVIDLMGHLQKSGIYNVGLVTMPESDSNSKRAVDKLKG